MGRQRLERQPQGRPNKTARTLKDRNGTRNTGAWKKVSIPRGEKSGTKGGRKRKKS